VSHNNNSIRDTCDRTIWLESGVINADGPTEDIVRMYEDYMKGRR
jgi:teichoic acid transport system ATP-binding protein